MRPNLLLFPVLLTGLLLGSCDEGEGEELPEVDCMATPPPTYDNVEIFDVSCVNCHSSDLMGPARQSAPVGVNYDSYDAAVANAEKGAHQVYVGQMPPPEVPVPAGNIPTEAHKQAFYAWALCGTPQ